MDELLKDYPVVIQLPVLWGEMDAFGHVNNVVYFRWFESGRIAYLERIRFGDQRDENDIGPILGSTRCRFRIPLTYPDTVSVGVRVSEIQDDRIVMEHLVMSHRHQKIAAEGDAIVVSFNYRENAKAALPAEVRKRIEKLEATVKYK